MRVILGLASIFLLTAGGNLAYAPFEAVPLSGHDCFLPAPQGSPHPCLVDQETRWLVLGAANSTLDRTREILQPGALVSSPRCTFGFVFQNVRTEELAISTAGHCIRGDRVSQRTLGLVWSEWYVGTRDVGEPIFVLNEGPGADLALVRISDSVALRNWQPHMWQVGGPCGWTHPPGAATPGFQVGHPHAERAVTPPGQVFAGAGTARVVRATSVSAFPAELGALGVAPYDGVFYTRGFAYGGDSGGPVRLATGEAVGVLTHTYRTPDVGASIGMPYAIGTSMARIFELVGPDWQLLDDPSCGQVLSPTFALPAP